MDKYVTRAPTWKMKTFNSTLNTVGTGGKKENKKTASKEVNKNKIAGVLKPLQDKTIGVATPDRLKKILSSRPDQPLVTHDGSDSGCSNLSDHIFLSCSNSQRELEIKTQELKEVENTPPAVNNNFIYGSSNKTPTTAVTELQEQEAFNTPQNAMSSTSQSDIPYTSPHPLDSRLLMRIQRDLNSPSASLRVRAIKAIQSPAQSVYTQFDVPHTEQDLITDEERCPPTPTKSIQELMKAIIVYVEVRTGEDNRSSGVKKVISALGAKVNDKLLRDTTHVIFKDGRLSTYKKAKQWNIPVVSILWIEACKNQKRICDPNLFPISNIDRYENPELYEKFKRHKSMQPDSEANKRVRVKGTTNTPKTPKTAGQRRSSKLASNTATISDNKQTDISQYFSRHEKMSTATNSINVKEESKADAMGTINSEEPASDTKGLLCCKLSDFEATPKKYVRASNGRHTMMPSAFSIETTNTSFAEMSLDNSSATPASDPFKMARHKSSVRCFSQIGTIAENTVINTPSKSVTEALSMSEIPSPNGIETPTRRIPNRKTTYTPKSLDMSEDSEDIVIQKRPVTRRRTLFGIEKSIMRPSIAQTPESSLTSLQRKHHQSQQNNISSQSPKAETQSSRTINTPAKSAQVDEILLIHTPPEQTGSLLEQYSATTVFSSSRLPGRRRTLFDVSMDIITARLQNINQSARRSIARPNDLDRLAESPTTFERVTAPNIFPAKRLNMENTLKPTAEKEKTIPTECSDAHGGLSETGVIAPKKKRKLFDPNECVLTPAKTTPNARRRRTLVPLDQTEAKSSVPTGRVAVAGGRGGSDSVRNKSKCTPRRSTFDFEEIKKPNNKTPNSTRFKTDTQSINSKSNSEVQKSKSGTVLHITESYAISKCNAASTSPVLVYTNMHKEQTKIIEEAVKELGGFRLEDNVNDETTHLVSLEPRRTMNMLRALLRGLWIVEYSWITDSLRARKWLNEEPYELRDFSRAVEICRSERQAFGKNYSCELFSNVGPFYVSSRCGSIPRENLIELIKLSGGKITDLRKRARYILSDANKTLEDKVYITPHWIVDSITHMQLQSFSKYSTLNSKSASSSGKQSQLLTITKPSSDWQPYSQI